MHTIGNVNNTAESVTKAGRLNRVAEKGSNVLERGRQGHFMAEFLELLGFPPAPKLYIFGKQQLWKE